MDDAGETIGADDTVMNPASWNNKGTSSKITWRESLVDMKG
jgi:hypothetical protein